MTQDWSFHRALFKRTRDGNVTPVSRRNSFTVTSRSSGGKKAVDESNLRGRILSFKIVAKGNAGHILEKTHG